LRSQFRSMRFLPFSSMRLCRSAVGTTAIAPKINIAGRDTG
jgi:hypothetical protein